MLQQGKRRQPDEAQVGLQLLREDGLVFACYSAMADTIYHAEVAARHSAGFAVPLPAHVADALLVELAPRF